MQGDAWGGAGGVCSLGLHAESLLMLGRVWTSVLCQAKLRKIFGCVSQRLACMRTAAPY